MPIVKKPAEINITLLEFFLRVVNAKKLGISGKRQGENEAIKPRKR
ncbi:MAG: hypothetical protein HeimC2_37340 [Candidatus Heimdallarchaeota archaeon LC_2]|nr:MAG: hypothetical protein HeimC2_37340 [Candidatus Heimdallarchaeota archaeon LC_2]